MTLDGKLTQRIMDVLVSVFPDRYELEKTLLFKMNVELDEVTKARRHDECVFYVIKWAKDAGRVGELLEVAQAAAPSNGKLHALANDVAKAAGSGGKGAKTVARPRRKADNAARRKTTPGKAKPKGGAGSKDATSWRLWKNGSTLKIAFLDGSSALQERVLKVAKEWTEYANLSFELVADPAESHVRISFKQEGSWSYTGTDALVVGKGDCTTNFGWLDENTQESVVHMVVLHEFGHVLGMIHEFQNPNAHIDWDWDRVFAYYQGPPYHWDREAVEQHFRPCAEEEFPGYREFDPTSIMMFSFSENLTKDKVALKQGEQLSESDKAFAAMLYPKDGTRLDTAMPRKGPPTIAREPDEPAKDDGKPAPKAPPKRSPTPPRRERPSTAPESLKLLFLAAQPLTKPIALEDEYAIIVTNLARSEPGKRVSSVYLPRITFRDLDKHLLLHEPTIVHFSGHGDAAGRLMFTDKDGVAQPASVEMVGKLFGILKDRIRCVVLNACYSHAQAKAIREHIDCVIGMSHAIKDTDALLFSEGFYMGVGHGDSIHDAFWNGCRKINAAGITEATATRDVLLPHELEAPSAAEDAEPALLLRDGVDPKNVILVPDLA